MGIMLCEGHGCIDITKIKEIFPNKAKRLTYINALITGLGD